MRSAVTAVICALPLTGVAWESLRCGFASVTSREWINAGMWALASALLLAIRSDVSQGGGQSSSESVS